MRDQLLGKRTRDDEPTVEELAGLAQELHAQSQAPVRTPATPAKVYQTHFHPFLYPDDPPFRVKYSATQKSQVVDAAKSYLINEYTQVRWRYRGMCKVSDLAKHYQLGPDWFKQQHDILEETKTTQNQKVGSRGGLRKWDEDMTKRASEIDKKDYGRRASNTTLASAKGG